MERHSLQEEQTDLSCLHPLFENIGCVWSNSFICVRGSVENYTASVTHGKNHTANTTCFKANHVEGGSFSFRMAYSIFHAHLSLNL